MTSKESRKAHFERNPWMRSFYYARLRCTQKTHPSYKTYGAAGIKFLITREEIKALWIRDSACLMSRPSIDRKINTSDYSFENCRFIELSENIGNRNRIYRKQGGPGRCNSHA